MVGTWHPVRGSNPQPSASEASVTSTMLPRPINRDDNTHNKALSCSNDVRTSVINIGVVHFLTEIEISKTIVYHNKNAKSILNNLEEYIYKLR